MSPVARVPLEVLQLAERGAKLFPCAPHSKRPLVDRWQDKNNTSDPALLLDIVRQVPDCNWAMVCGRASGIFALDYDCKAGRRGLEWYQHALEEHGPEWIDTIRVRTPSDGKHSYHQWIEGIGKDNTGKLAPGVDVQGQGSYVLTPPSEVDGKRYQWEDCDGETDIAPVPAWLLPDIQRIFMPAPERTERAERAEPAERKIPVGHRHATLLRHGKVLAKAGALWQGILRDFEILNQQFEQRLTHQELEYQAHDMYERYRSRVHFGAAANGTKTTGAVGEVILVPFSEIKPEPVNFLKDPYIARGMLTMLTGDPGVGKSFIAESIGAEVTKQGEIVFYLTLENHPRKVLRPRFDVLDGDPTKIYWIKAVQFGDPEDGETRTVTLEDIAGLEKKVREYHARLIIIDPLQSFLGASVDAWRPNETRPVLDRLVELAERHEVAVLILRHGTKAQTGRIIHRGLGSIDFTGAVRSELYAGETADKKEKAMAHIKSNIGPLGRTLGYKITSMDEQGTVYKTGYFEWTGESDLKTADLTQPEPTEEEVSALEDAKSFLIEYLTDGPKERELVIKKSKARAISYITLRRAKKDLKIGWELRDGLYFWFLPSSYT